MCEWLIGPVGAEALEVVVIAGLAVVAAILRRVERRLRAAEVRQAERLAVEAERRQ